MLSNHNLEYTQVGCCKFCGQVYMKGFPDNITSLEEMNEYATQNCKCDPAVGYAKKKKRSENARKSIDQLFGEHANERNFRPIDIPETIDLLVRCADLIIAEKIMGVTVKINSDVKAVLSITANDKVKIERVETSKCKFEE